MDRRKFLVGAGIVSAGLIGAACLARRFSKGRGVPKLSRERGTVKWLNSSKGFGFIKRQSGGDVFVHFSAIHMDGCKTLTDGQQVEFEVKQGPKGYRTENVTCLN